MLQTRGDGTFGGLPINGHGQRDIFVAEDTPQNGQADGDINDTPHHPNQTAAESLIEQRGKSHTCGPPA